MTLPCHAHHSVPSKSARVHFLGRYTVESEVPENDELDLFINQTVGSRVSCGEGGEAGVGGGVEGGGCCVVVRECLKYVTSAVVSVRQGWTRDEVPCCLSETLGGFNGSVFLPVPQIASGSRLF